MPNPWTAADLPPPPHFRGTRANLDPGDELEPGDVGNVPYDTRQMCWATTELDDALQWTLQRKVRLGPTLYVYEVELVDPEIDPNVHRIRSPDETPTSVMAPNGRVLRLVVQRMRQEDHPHAMSMYMWSPPD